MATRKKKATVTDLAPTNGGLIVIKPPTQEEINQALAQAQAAIGELHKEAESLVITDHQTYSQADSLLHRINDGDKLAESKFRPVIELLRLPLEAIYELKRGVCVPLDADRKTVKAKMGDYQLQEKIRLDLEAAENLRKAKEIQEQWLRDNPPAPAPAPSGFPPQPPNLGVVPLAPAPTPAITYLAPPSTPAPQAAHSSARFERRVRTTDIDLLIDAATAGCLEGLTPGQCLDLLTIKPSILQSWFQSNPEAVSKWPGVEVYDQPRIIGR